MTGMQLRAHRKARGWTQTELAERLGLSQGYVCLLERAQRPVPAALTHKVTRLLNLPATAVPVGSASTVLADEAAATALATLGYPGFAYRRPRQRLNPAEVLLRTLKSAELDARLVEALVWVAVTYADLDWDWVVRQAKVEDSSEPARFPGDPGPAAGRTEGRRRGRCSTHEGGTGPGTFPPAARGYVSSVDDGGRAAVASPAPVTRGDALERAHEPQRQRARACLGTEGFDRSSRRTRKRTPQAGIAWTSTS